MLAAIGRGQLRVLQERVAARRRNFAFYSEALGDLPGIAFMPDAGWGTHTQWLTTLTIDPRLFGVDREAVRQALNAAAIEARPVWKPMHLQPLFCHCPVISKAVPDGCWPRALFCGSQISRRPTWSELFAAICRAAG